MLVPIWLLITLLIIYLYIGVAIVIHFIDNNNKSTGWTWVDWVLGPIVFAVCVVLWPIFVVLELKYN